MGERQAPLSLEGGRQAPLSPVGGPPSRRGGATGPLPPRAPGQEPICKLEKKLQTDPVALWAGDRGIFSKFFETDIYF